MYVLLGAHGTGKSTLLQYLKNKRKDYYTTDGFSRPVRKVFQKQENPVLEQSVINELTEWGFLNYLEHEKVITTRSVLDIYLYNKHLFNNVNVYYLNLFLKNINKINKVFYLPIEFEIEDDGVRMSRKLQYKIDEEIQWLIQEYFELKSKIVILKGDVEERFNTMEQYLVK